MTQGKEPYIMKWSNSALALIAALTLSLSIVATIPIIASIPTSVISVPAENGSKGNGFAIKIPRNLSPHQSQLLDLAYEVAKEDGHKQPQILQGILLQETQAGAMNSYKVAGHELGLKTNERYYGILQIKLAAAKDVLAAYPELIKRFKFHTKTDEEIIANLMLNDER